MKEFCIISTHLQAAEDTVPQTDLNPIANPSPVMRGHTRRTSRISTESGRGRLLLAF